MTTPAVCAGKRRYKSEAAAAETLRRMRKRVVDPFRLRAYRCDACKGWHIGNAPFTVAPDDAPKAGR